MRERERDGGLTLIIIMFQLYRVTFRIVTKGNVFAVLNPLSIHLRLFHKIFLFFFCYFQNKIYEICDLEEQKKIKARFIIEFVNKSK